MYLIDKEKPKPGFYKTLGSDNVIKLTYNRIFFPIINNGDFEIKIMDPSYFLTGLLIGNSYFFSNGIHGYYPKHKHTMIYIQNQNQILLKDGHYHYQN